MLKNTSLKTEIARSARGPKSKGLRAEDALAEPYLVQKILLTWLDYSRSQSSQWRLWISKQSSICSRGAGLGHPMDQVVSVQNKKLLKKHRGACKSSWSRDRNPSHLHWQFLGIYQSLWRYFLKSLYVDTKQIRNKWDCWKSSAQSKKKAPQPYCCYQVWMNLGRHIPWYVTPLKNVTDLWSDGKIPYERRFGQPFKGPITPFGFLLSITLFLRKTTQFSIKMEKVLPGLFFGYALYAGSIWKGDMSVADIELENDGRTGNLLKRDSIQKRWCFPKVKFQS